MLILKREENDLRHLPDPLGAEDIHNRWSDFIGGHIFQSRDKAHIESCCDELKRTLSVASNYLLPKYAPGYLGSAYLTSALAIGFKGESLAILSQLWNCFLHRIAEDRHHGGWQDLNQCVENILSSRKSLDDFLSPSHLTIRNLSGLLAQ